MRNERYQGKRQKGKGKTLLALRWPRRAAVAFCFVLGTLLPAAFGLVQGFPVANVHDELSFLLGADTFAHGRLTNPTPPLPEFFEAPHILVEPSYNAKYPPGQSLVLALGQVVGGHPIYGVWLSCGLFAASLCWMLQAWTSRHWALAVTILATLTLGTSSYWAQSYWGGMLPACGAALLYGGVRRLLHSPRVGPSIAMAMGLLLMAITRPFEGLLVGIPSGILIVRWLVHEWRTSLRPKVTSSVLPACGVLVVGAAGMAVYNGAVTGDWRRAPYSVHHAQYFHQGLFLFSPLRQPERTPVERIAAFYAFYRTPPVNGLRLAAQTARNLHFRLFRTLGVAFGIAESPRGIREPYRGVLLWVVLLVAVWRRSAALFLVTLLVAVVAESLVWRYVPVSRHLDRYPVVLMPLLAIIWIVPFVRTLRVNRWVLFLAVSIVTVVSGQALIWWWWPHYAAPVLPLLLAVVAISLQRVARSRPVQGTLRLGQILIILLAINFATFVAIYSLNGTFLLDDGRLDLRSREALKGQLESQDGPHLVFVQYGPDASPHYEWVYNGADLAGSRVIFAHHLGDGKNAELVRVFPGRATWIVKVSDEGTQLEPYTPGAAGR